MSVGLSSFCAQRVRGLHIVFVFDNQLSRFRDVKGIQKHWCSMITISWAFVGECLKLHLQLEFLAPLISKLSLLTFISAFLGSLLHSGYSNFGMQGQRGQWKYLFITQRTSATPDGRKQGSGCQHKGSEVVNLLDWGGVRCQYAYTKVKWTSLI